MSYYMAMELVCDVKSTALITKVMIVCNMDLNVMREIVYTTLGINQNDSPFTDYDG